MSLSDKEIDHLIIKLREKYKVSTREYKTRLFNLDAFEDRLQMALRKRMNLEGFILSEIANYEKIKHRCEEEKNPKQVEENSFTRQVDKIIEENTARIKKYNSINFHPLAEIEMTHLYGALTEFAQCYFSVLWIVLTENEHRDCLHRFEDKIFNFAVPRGKKHPKRIDDHVLALSRRDSIEIEIEKDKNIYLKESGFLLHEIIDFTNSLLTIKNRDWELPLQFNKLYAEGETRKNILTIFSGTTPYGAILKVEERAAMIIKDFRLESFKRKSFT